jgi:hypothetical protein
MRNRVRFDKSKIKRKSQKNLTEKLLVMNVDFRIDSGEYPDFFVLQRWERVTNAFLVQVPRDARPIIHDYSRCKISDRGISSFPTSYCCLVYQFNKGDLGLKISTRYKFYLLD